MNVTETIVRECCAPKDLKKVEGCQMWNFTIPDLKFCIYCGAYWQHHTFMDAAGSSDWEYRKMPLPKSAP